MIKKNGFSLLTTVIVISVIMTIILYALQANLVLSARRASSIHYSQAAFFAAEGATYQAINLYSRGEFPPQSLPQTDQWEEDGVKLTRQITLDEENVVTITVAGEIKNAHRTFQASFQKGGANRKPIDAVLVIDCSNSMYYELENGRIPMYYMKKAAIGFIEAIEEAATNSGIDDQISLVVYGDTEDGIDKTEAIYNLSGLEDFGEMKQLIRDIGTLDPSTGEILYQYSRTPSANGLAAAITEMETNGRAMSDQYLVFFSDGLANRELASVPDSNITSLINTTCGEEGGPCNKGCHPFPCFDTIRGEGCNPYDGGNCCTNDAIRQAELARGELDLGFPYPYDYKVFAVFLENIPPEWADFVECGSEEGGGGIGGQQALDMSIILGKQTMQAIANPPENGYEFYFEAQDPDELKPIFEEIASIIVEPGQLIIKEVFPEATN